ncbi:MAG: Fic family protein [Nanoarchaeota archaeon]
MRIIQRKKGNKEYYYLQHSFRKNNKVVTKEKYLGQKIPKDIEKIKEQLLKESKKDLYEKLEKIKKNFQIEWKRMPKSAKEKELQEISIAFTYNTNAIEGSTITLEEAREIIEDKISPNRPLRDIKETEAHNKVFLEMLKNQKRLNKSLILKWHQDIFGNTKSDISGRYRDFFVRVGPYLAPDWQDIENLMKNYFKDINKLDVNPVEISAIAHYRFEKIHPFGDGNGRIGRLIMNYLLWEKGYPMLIIEYKNRSSYYKAFTRGEQGFVNYFIRRYLAVHGRRLK